MLQLRLWSFCVDLRDQIGQASQASASIDPPHFASASSATCIRQALTDLHPLHPLQHHTERRWPDYLRCWPWQVRLASRPSCPCSPVPPACNISKVSVCVVKRGGGQEGGGMGRVSRGESDEGMSIHVFRPWIGERCVVMCWYGIAICPSRRR